MENSSLRAVGNERRSGTLRSRGIDRWRRDFMNTFARFGGPIPGRILGCCLLAASSALALALAAAPAAPAKPAVGTMMSPSLTYGKLLSGMEEEFVGAAEAMPAEKYDFAPPTT